MNGQVTLNGVADGTTANIIGLGYVIGLDWQENADDLWWNTSKPSDQCGPVYGTSIDPVLAVTRRWNGGSGLFGFASGWTPSGVRATGNSTVSVIGAGNGETIQLVSAHLNLGGEVIQTSTALQFLAPFTDFGDTSEISLNNTQAHPRGVRQFGAGRWRVVFIRWGQSGCRFEDR